MNHNSPVSPRPLSHLCQAQRRVLSTAQLRAHGVTLAQARERCRPGGDWQRLLPGVFLLHPGPPTAEERLHAALLYAVRPGTAAGPLTAVTAPQGPGHHGTAGLSGGQVGGGRPEAAPRSGARSAEGPGEAMVTGLAALALHRFGTAPPLAALDPIDVLVPRTRRLRSVSFARLVRCATLPEPDRVRGVPVAPVPRALADAVAQLAGTTAVHRVLAEAVHGGHCDVAAAAAELRRARLLELPHVAEAVQALLDGHRSLAEDLLYRTVREHHLPEPLWNVDLQLPGGPHLGAVDAYWPDHAVALELDTEAPRTSGGDWEEDVLWAEFARRREHLERLGIIVVRTAPHSLCEAPRQQAAVFRTALMAAADRDPAAYVRVLPR
ncbi:hypothetical protein [Streptomyces sp. TS71-3]|uniref:hypothetical protein n=1 Tax=Streptomyces sp. TS71-3 TaxID=2733862 RepID=UPI001B252916|nr:hypothetical protein [Streptomyces sp. TS71-3]GHJ37591.1 hypothetical protein Sm713_32000 [Streptomyces sp. TS71-3]